jgi:hypothetical protein
MGRLPDISASKAEFPRSAPPLVAVWARIAVAVITAVPSAS